MFYIHIMLLLAIIFIGSRYGNIAFGLFGGLGVSILSFVFGITPGNPPTNVILIIIAVVAASSTLEASGGLALLVQYAEKFLRKHPSKIVFLGPLCAYSLTLIIGTGHSVYALLPVIYDVSIKNGIRPERSMPISAIASQIGITASPIAAATAVVMTCVVTNNVDITLGEVLMVTIPATLTGVIISAMWSLKRGKDLQNDPEFLVKYQNPHFKAQLFDYTSLAQTKKAKKQDSNAIRGLSVFIIGIFSVIFVALSGEHLGLLSSEINTSAALQFLMLSVGAIILLATNIDTKTIVKTNVFSAGMSAAMIIFGIAWMSDSVISHNQAYIVNLVENLVKTHPWTFAIAMYISSIFLKSQAAVLTIMLPLGFALHIPPEILIGVIPACYAYYIFPFYPSVLAAITFDRSGTTKIGKYIVNNSFIMPGLIAVSTATCISYALSIGILSLWVWGIAMGIGCIAINIYMNCIPYKEWSFS